MIDHAAISSYLHAAARLVRRNGLAQGHLYDYDQADAGTPLPECRICALGAIHTVTSGTPSPDDWRADAYRAVSDHVSAYMAEHHVGWTVPKWNDEPGRTAVQVALLLRRAAAWSPATAETVALAA